MLIAKAIFNSFTKRLQQLPSPPKMVNCLLGKEVSGYEQVADGDSRVHQNNYLFLNLCKLIHLLCFQNCNEASADIIIIIIISVYH